MIGVISKPDQAAIVAEFFELFKTPWESYVPSRQYDVVIATTDPLPEVDAKLLVIYGAGAREHDVRNVTGVSAKHIGGFVKYDGTALPIYNDLATFEEFGPSKACLTATSGIVGLRNETTKGSAVVRLGYDLFEEVRFLLSAGQPVEHAGIPALDMHIGMLRQWIINEGIPFFEIPPTPAGHSFIVCLTHDIDFIGIRNHKFDHTMWGFLYRATLGGARDFLRRRISFGRLWKMWRAAASLPFVYLGWEDDFWDPFTWYLNVERGLPATYYLIPFKSRAGEHVPGAHAHRRAAAYDVRNIRNWMDTLCEAGCELGVHGIDAWHNVDKGRAELSRLAESSEKPITGIRIHWLLQNHTTTSLLEEEGYGYDSTSGYNETIGYRNGTTQVFRPLNAQSLLELPMHIQDGALFFENRLNLCEPEAERRCKNLIDNVGKLGGVLTLLWHDRSHGPERFWGDFYVRLLKQLKVSDAWFATAAETVSWFRSRRGVRFERMGNANGVQAILPADRQNSLPPLGLRVYSPSPGNDTRAGKLKCTELPWDSRQAVEFDSSTGEISPFPIRTSALEVC